MGGRLLLRIEDIDPVRSRSEHEAGIYEDLAWLGLRWEKPVRRQSEHLDDYRAAFRQLKARGVVYPCFCTRREIAAAVAALEAAEGRPWPRDPDGVPLYPGTCRRLAVASLAERMASGAAHASRISMAAALAPAERDGLGVRRFDPSGARTWSEAQPDRWGDAVLVRKETPTSYHLSVVVDDALQGITHVVRGRDLDAATDLHVLLQRLLGLPSPAYHHHALIRDPGGLKLSKSLGSESLAALRERGVNAADVRRQLGFEA